MSEAAATDPSPVLSPGITTATGHTGHSISSLPIPRSGSYRPLTRPRPSSSAETDSADSSTNTAQPPKPSLRTPHVAVTVSGWVTVLGCVGGACDVSVGVVAVRVVRVEVVRVVIVGAVRVDVRVPLAALLPPPHDESAKPANAGRIAAAASLDGRTLPTPPIIARLARPSRGCLFVGIGYLTSEEVAHRTRASVSTPAIRQSTVTRGSSRRDIASREAVR